MVIIVGMEGQGADVSLVCSDLEFNFWQTQFCVHDQSLLFHLFVIKADKLKSVSTEVEGKESNQWMKSQRE